VVSPNVVLIKTDRNLLTTGSNSFIDFLRKNPVIAANLLLVRDGEALKLAPIQAITLNEWWVNKFSLLTATRGSGKTFLSAVYIALKCLLYPNTRVGIFAPAFRQAKFIFAEFTRLYEDSPLLQQCVERPPTKLNDHCICEYKQVRQGIGKSTIKALPIGTDGSTIRGERCSDIIMDEVVHIPESIFRATIQPMMSTSRNPMQRVSKIEKLSQQFDGDVPTDLLSTDNGYIGITSGFYQFNYWWTEILGFYNQIKKGSKLYNLRFIPYTELPEGFFEMDIVRDAQLNSPSHVFLTEWMAEWIADSEGAFPMSLLESCRDSSILPRSSRDLNLDKSKQFIFGIDVARERDSSAIVIIELGGISKITHIVELEEMPFPEQVKKIFELVEVFNPLMIYMDEFGGGQTLRDSLAKPESVGWPASKKIIPVDEDIQHSGRRILSLCSPTSTFIEDSNNCAKIMLEQGVIRFPTADHPIETTKKVNIKGVFKEVDLVQELINQVASVVVTQTGQGRLHYDLPGTKAQSSTMSLNIKKKDLYSAFILGCRCVYDLQWQPKVDNLMVNVGVIKEIQTVSNSYRLTHKPNSDIIQTGNSRIVGGTQDEAFKKIIPSGGIIVSRYGKTKR
jgi:hypothetical protein